MDWRTEVELLEADEPSRLRVCSNKSISVVTGFFQRRPRDAMSGKDLRGHVVILRFHQMYVLQLFLRSSKCTQFLSDGELLD